MFRFYKKWRHVGELTEVVCTIKFCYKSENENERRGGQTLQKKGGGECGYIDSYEKDALEMCTEKFAYMKMKIRRTRRDSIVPL